MKPEKHISLKCDDNNLILEWKKPVIKARLVMVDECILRIDYHINKISIMEKIYFPEGFNHQPFLKCPIWNNKEVIETPNKIIYQFNSPINGGKR